VGRALVQVKQREADFGKTGNEAGVDSCRDYIQQMGYREYARYLSFHFPFTHERSLLEHLRACPWNFDQRLFKVGALVARASLPRVCRCRACRC
jgi:hypothetical protein